MPSQTRRAEGSCARPACGRTMAAGRACPSLSKTSPSLCALPHGVATPPLPAMQQLWRQEWTAAGAQPGWAPSRKRPCRLCSCSKRPGRPAPRIRAWPHTHHVQRRHLDVRLLKGGKEVLDVGGAGPAVHQLHTEASRGVGGREGVPQSVTGWLWGGACGPSTA